MMAWEIAIGVVSAFGFWMMTREYMKRTIYLPEIALLFASLAGLAWFVARLWGMQ